jgi:hypothetical protein
MNRTFKAAVAALCLPLASAKGRSVGLSLRIILLVIRKFSALTGQLRHRHCGGLADAS